MSRKTAEHFWWRDVCEGWVLHDSAQLTVLEESMPPGTSEEVHLHGQATQFFYVLSGLATIVVGLGVEETSVCLPAGEGVKIPPQVAHRICNLADQPLSFLVISCPSHRGDRVSPT